jgi:predicted metal-dependent phosphotriesterase family hydrolase
VLEDEHYLVDLNRVSGRIDAQPSREKTGRKVHLMVRVAEKKGRVQVDVQTGSHMDADLRSGRLDEAPVLEFLHELDLRMQGTRD